MTEEEAEERFARSLASPMKVPRTKLKYWRNRKMTDDTDKRELTSKELQERMVSGIHPDSKLGRIAADIAASRKLGAAKDDIGKLQWGLMPWDALTGIMRILMYGAKKYTARNWEQGFDYSRLYSALQRHLISWWQLREKDDPESRLPHLWHAGCCILFLIAHEIRGIGHDDRPGRSFPEAPDPLPEFLKRKDDPE